MIAETETNLPQGKPDSNKPHWQFDSLKARLAGIKSGEVRRLNPVERLKRFKLEPELPSRLALFLEKQMTRIRIQLGYIDRLILRETQRANPDGKRLKDLAEAQDRLLDQLQRKPVTVESQPQSPKTKAPESVW